jgi:alcohol dehydrogenase
MPVSHPAENPLQENHPHLRLVFGNGCVAQTGELARELGATKALLVTDSGIVAAGHAGRVRENLEAAGIGVSVFDRSKENPTTACVDECVAVAKTDAIDFILGLGGGSSMDTAKGCNFIFTNGGAMKDYWGIGKASQPMLPSIMIPTTAGTGSECQSFALIADNATHQKMACGDPKAMAKVAILDPELTLSQPPRVTACTGIDAIAHAVETAVTRKRNETSLKYSRAAFQMMLENFSRVLELPDDLHARGQMLLGAAYAGTAIEHSMLGAAHSAANPLTAHYDVVHGQAVGMMLPHVVRFNAVDETIADGYAALVKDTAVASSNGTLSAEALAQAMEALLDSANLPRALAQCGVEESQLETLSGEAAQQWTASFNPRDITAADFTGLYQKAFAS